MVAIFIREKKNSLACYSLEVLFNIKGELMCFEEIFFCGRWDMSTKCGRIQ